MAKKDKLHVVNRWNTPAYMLDRRNNNIFDGFTFGQSNQMNTNPFGATLTAPRTISPYNSWMSPQQKLQANYQVQNLSLQPSTGNNVKTTGGGAGAGWAAAGQAAAGVGLEMAGSIGQSEDFKRGLWDRGDPLHYLADGRESMVGNALGDTGVGLFKAGAQSGNWQLMVAGGAAKAVGSLINAGWGVKENKENVNLVKQNTSAARNAGQAVGAATSTDDLLNMSGQMTGGSNLSAGDLYKGGLFSKGKARRKGQRLLDAENAALAYQNHALTTGANNVDSIMNDDIMANFGAFGGPLDTMGGENMEAVDYGFMSDYLTTKRQQNTVKDKIGGISPMPVTFALGGDMQTNGSDFTTGLTRIDAGGSHESNSNEGVQVGVDNEGVPNLVEEGETIFNDYVYSTRILADAETKQYFHLPKKRDISFAEISKKLEKEASERPNDPISRAGLEAQMSKLAEHQERQKQEMEAEKAKAAFEALTPEQQTALMQQQAMAEQQSQMQQPSQEEMLMAQQQQVMQGDGSEANLGQEPQMNAMGGRINRFSGGGNVIKKEDGLIDYDQSVFDLPEVVVTGKKKRNGQAGLTPEQARQAATVMEALDGIDRQQKQDEVMDALQDELKQRKEDRELYRRNRIHYYAGGGLKESLYKAMGWHTDRDFYNWANKNKVRNTATWGTPGGINVEDSPEEFWKDIILGDNDFLKGIQAENPAFADALSKGYDFGTYTPSGNGKATIQSINKGNWKATDGNGWLGSDDLAFKQATKDMSEAQIKALTTEQLAQLMTQTDAYKNTSKWLETPDNALLYLNTLLEDPDTPEVAKQHARKYVQDGKWKDGYNYSYADVFGKVRSTNPGTYWHSVMEANRGNKSGNLVWNDETNTWEPIIGDVPEDWVSAGNYSWSSPENDYAYNYYRRPTVPETGTETGTGTGEDGNNGSINRKGNDRAVRNRWENLRYAGLLGPAAGLGLMAAGVGKPDYSRLDAAVDMGNSPAYTADYKPLGNYLTYRPMDIWYEQNRLNANSRATDRAIMNASNGNSGATMAGLLANGYNSQIASGELYRQALEYNDKQRQQVAEFNRGTDQFNADAYNRNSQFNAEARNRGRQSAAQLSMEAARQRMDADAGWYNSLYGNLSGLFKGLGDLGTENYRMNRVAKMAKDGVFSNLGDSELSDLVFKSGRKTKK